MLTAPLAGPGLALLALLGTVPSSPSDTPWYETRCSPGTPCPTSVPFVSMPGAAPSLHLPTALRASLRERLDLDSSATFAGWRPDLNGDGVPDWVVWALGSACGGTGNCIAALADGDDARVLGAFVAASLLITPRRGTWPDVESFATLGEATGVRESWVARDGAYQSSRSRPMGRASYAAEIARFCVLGH